MMSRVYAYSADFSNDIWSFVAQSSAVTEINFSKIHAKMGSLVQFRSQHRIF